MFVVTIPVTANTLLRGQLAFLREQGFDVTVISSPGPELDLVARRESVEVIAVPMAREIDPVADVVSLGRLTQVIRKLRPDIVNASTAKAGLLGMLAASAAGVPIRVYLLRGLRLETERGVKREVLAMTDRVSAACAHRVICVSESLRERYVSMGLAPAEKCAVLGAGASNGVEVARFAPTEARRQAAAALRDKLRIPAGAPVIGFIGRPVIDKGIVELLDAFADVARAVPDARLVMVGAGLADDRLPALLAHRFEQPNVRLVERVDEPAPYYAMMDVLAFPSHREGLPNAPLEAAAAGIPTVGSQATGVRDVVVDQVTGQLVPTGDAAALASALVRYLEDPDLRRRHGDAARERVNAQYARERVWKYWCDEYVRLLAAKSLPLPQASN